jgi:hypothetical protein
LTEISCRIHGAYPNILTTAEVKAAQPEFVRVSIGGQPMRKVSFKQFNSNERVSCRKALGTACLTASTPHNETNKMSQTLS